MGGAIHCDAASPVFRNCTIIANSAAQSGGAVSVEEWGAGQSAPRFFNCTIQSNSAEISGGGIYSMYGTEPEFYNCLIDDNTAEDHGGGAYHSSYSSNSRPLFDHCVFSNNYASGGGGGFYAGSGSQVRIINCTFFTNLSQNDGAGVLIENANPTLNDCIFSNHQVSSAIHTDSNLSSSLAYSDFWNNISDISGAIPNQFGNLSTVNVNDDSCDTYCNIFLDPVFVAPYTLDFNLQSVSPCIDAGDPAFPHDPDSTIADIGAFYYFHNVSVEEPDYEFRVSDFELYSPYPNPFNQRVALDYMLPVAAYVRISVYDLLGREALVLVNEYKSAGSHEIQINGESLASGMYFVTLQTQNFTKTRKIIYLK